VRTRAIILRHKDQNTIVQRRVANARWLNSCCVILDSRACAAP
jgi:hypothetical protein